MSSTLPFKKKRGKRPPKVEKLSIDEKEVETTKDLSKLVASCSDYIDPEDSDFDQSNPRSIINLIPEALKRRLKSTPRTVLRQTEEELEEELFPDGRINPIALRAKLAFWDEYDRVQAKSIDIMDMSIVLKNSCTSAYFYTTLCDRPAFIAWLFIPPADWTSMVKQIGYVALRRMEEAVNLPVTLPGPDHEPNTRLIDIQHKILQTCDMRINGAIVQRIDQRTLNMNLNAQASPEVTDKLNAAASQSLSMAELDAKIAALERRSLQAANPGVIDIDMMKQAKSVTMLGHEQPEAVISSGSDDGAHS